MFHIMPSSTLQPAAKDPPNVLDVKLDAPVDNWTLLSMQGLYL